MAMGKMPLSSLSSGTGLDMSCSCAALSGASCKPLIECRGCQPSIPLERGGGGAGDQVCRALWSMMQISDELQGVSAIHTLGGGGGVGALETSCAALSGA